MRICPFQDNAYMGDGIRCCPRWVRLSGALRGWVFTIYETVSSFRCGVSEIFAALGYYRAVIGSSSEVGSNRHFCYHTQTENIEHCEWCILTVCTVRMLSGWATATRHLQRNLEHARLSHI